MAGVALFQAPVGIVDQFRGTDPDHAEGGEGDAPVVGMAVELVEQQRHVLQPGVGSLAVERHHRSDSLRGRPLEGVDHDQLLHDVEVERLRVTLDDKGVGAAHTLGVVDVDLAVRKDGPLHSPQFHPQDVSHFLSQGFIRGT